MYLLYSLITAGGLLLLSPYFFVRSLVKGKSLNNLPQRLGWDMPQELRASPGAGAAGTVWIHAVSVGEALAVVPLARELKAKFPERRLVVSTTTATGQRIAREQMKFADAVFYFPLDWMGPVRRVFSAVKPDLVIVVETEIWPNFLRHARCAQVPVVFVNGRLSERSSRGFQRAVALPGGVLRKFLRQVLNDATLFLMQSEPDAARLLALGVEPAKVRVAGNLKYDAALPQPTAFSKWLEAELLRSRREPVIVAGSVVEKEEAPVLRAFELVEKQFPQALLVLAPRKPERFDAAAQTLGNSHRSVVRRSSIATNGLQARSEDTSSQRRSESALEKSGSAMLLDSLGELASVYALADAVFVGGSLVPAGGHNILEPACFGRPPVYGGSMENFREMAAAFTQARAGIQVRSAEELGEAWLSLLGDHARAREMGAAAKALVEKNRGATVRTFSEIAPYLEGHAPIARSGV